MAIYFYKEFGELGYLASYSSHGFVKDGIYWKTVEHYYQAQKFYNEDVKRLIINAATPKQASTIGRDRTYKLREDWEQVKNEIMYEAVLAKFLQNSDLAEKLIATGNEEIIEDTKKENYWGCGPNRDGLNIYGKILCRVREELKVQKQKGEK